MGVARNVFPVGTNIGTLVPLIGSYQYSHSVFGCAVTTKLVPPLSVDEYAALAPHWRSTGAEETRGERFAAARLFLTTLTALELNY